METIWILLSILRKRKLKVMNFLSKTSIRVIKRSKVRGQGSLASLLLGAGLSLVIFSSFMVLLRGTEWFWNLLETLLERIRLW